MSYIIDKFLDKKWLALYFWPAHPKPHVCFYICIPAHRVISFLTLQSDIRIQRALRQTIGRRRLQILVIEGCCFGSESTLHNQCFGLCGCGGHGWGSYPWLQNGIWHADTDWGVSPPENPDATAARVCELLLRSLSSPAYFPPLSLTRIFFTILSWCIWTP